MFHTTVKLLSLINITELFSADGWAMGEIDEVIIEALHEASVSYFKSKPAAFYGMGSTTTWKPTIHD